MDVQAAMSLSTHPLPLVTACWFTCTGSEGLCLTQRLLMAHIPNKSTVKLFLSCSPATIISAHRAVAPWQGASLQANAGSPSQTSTDWQPGSFLQHIWVGAGLPLEQGGKKEAVWIALLPRKPVLKKQSCVKQQKAPAQVHVTAWRCPATRECAGLPTATLSPWGSTAGVLEPHARLSAPIAAWQVTP